MKNFILLLSFLFITFSYSQKKYDIYVQLNMDLHKFDKKFEGENDSTIIQVFRLKNQSQSLKKIYLINKDGLLKTLTKYISEKGSWGHCRNKPFHLLYLNENNKNPPKIIRKNKIKNILTYPDDFKNVKIDEIVLILRKAENIYVIETDVNFGYYMIKKVKLQTFPCL